MKRLLLAFCLLAAPLAAQPTRFSLAKEVQPGFTATLLGDTYYALNATTFGRVAGNVTTTRKFWCQVGTGSVSAAPGWCALVSGDIPNNAANTTGSAAKWTTARLLAGNSVDGSANATFANKFIVQGTADTGLSAAQFLGALSTCILKNTTTTGVLSCAAGSDIPSLLTTKGDLPGFSTVPGRYGIGTDGWVLTADAASTFGFKWAVSAGGSPLTTKGDIFSYSTTNVRVPVGADGYGVVADSTQAVGWKWAPISGSGTVTSIVVSPPLTGGTITTTGTIGCPPAVASGGSHASGCVPDPGASAGSTKYLREDMTYVVPSGSGGGYAGTVWIGADPSFTVATGYERVPASYPSSAPGRVQLKAGMTFTNTVADAKTNVPIGWSLANSSLVLNADANTTTANGLYANFSLASNYATAAIPLFYRVYDGGDQVFVFRVATAMTFSNYADVGVFLVDGTINVSLGVFVWNNTLQLPGAAPAVTGTQRGNGVWVKILRKGSALLSYYNLANQSAPPTTWTYGGGIAYTTTLAALGGLKIGFGADRSNATVAITGSLLYFDDSGSASGWTPGLSAIGFDSTSPVLTLVSGFDLGASAATVTDANVRLALAEIANPREWDSAAWTWSVSRDASAPVACGGGTYAAAASVTVGGTGRYLSVCGKAASTGNVLPASVNATELRIPFTP
jgi:hypothetical protein